MNKGRRFFLKHAGIIASATLIFPDRIFANRVNPYPTPPGLQTSDDITLTANSQNIWVEKFEVPLPVPPYKKGEDSFIIRAKKHIGEVQRVLIANFEADGKINIQISTKEPIKKYVIRPKSLNIKATGLGTHKLEFKFSAPGNLYIEINDLPHLLLFANEPKPISFKAANGGFKYFGPGEHRPGIIIPKDNETIYIAPGAIVHGAINAKGIKNLRVSGYGILDATSLEGNGNPLLLNKCSDVKIEGIIIRNKTRGWMCNCQESYNLTFRNIKVLGFGANNDGLDIVNTSKVLVDNAFFRCTDDCIALKTGIRGNEDITVQNSILFGFASADGFTIGFEEKGPVNNVKILNCDIIGGRGRSRTIAQHSAFSIVCDGPGPITNVLFEDIRVEDVVETSNFELAVTDGQQYVKMSPGSISNITLKNVHWERSDVGIYLHGHDAKHMVSNVTFINCSAGGKIINNISDPIFKSLDFTENIRFK